MHLLKRKQPAIIEAVSKWAHLLSSRHYKIVTDQRSVAFMFDSRKRTKVKNAKIMSWRLELASFSYSIRYRPGKENVAPDALTRTHCASISSNDAKLKELHEGLCHSGISRMLHFVCTKNLPFYTEDVKRVNSSCRTCAQVKPDFFRPTEDQHLIKATRPMERLSIDFKGPLPTNSKNKYLFTAVDEYSSFPWVAALWLPVWIRYFPYLVWQVTCTRIEERHSWLKKWRNTYTKEVLPLAGQHLIIQLETRNVNAIMESFGKP